VVRLREHGFPVADQRTWRRMDGLIHVVRGVISWKGSSRKRGLARTVWVRYLQNDVIA